jgi:hypothetical protein
LSSVDHDKALSLLMEAKDGYSSYEVKHLSSGQKRAIDAIILGDHKTFRYLLVTALLAKTINPRVHPRSLQAQANLQGAYDARSLCHFVWVPFEREHLDSRLGGSNEPYLNKPARFPSVDKSNAVRAGKDRQYLNSLYDLLEALNDADGKVIKDAFMHAFKQVMTRDGITGTDEQLTELELSSALMDEFLTNYMMQSFGGEVPVSLVGAILSMRFVSKKSTVKVHPANQAGSSSNEVGDIDVYDGDIVVLPVEVKDKTFGRADVNHAVSKAKQSDCRRLLFATGPQGRPGPDADIKALVNENAAEGFDLTFISVAKLVQAECSLFNATERHLLLGHIDRILKTMRAKDETKRHFKAVIDSLEIT